MTIQCNGQLVVHDVTAVGVHEVHQKVEACCDPHIHHIGMPLLVRTHRTKVIFAAGSRRPLPAGQQVRFAEHPIHRAFTHTRHLVVDHLPGQLPIPHLGVIQSKPADRFALLRQDFVDPARSARLILKACATLPVVIHAARYSECRKRLKTRPS